MADAVSTPGHAFLVFSDDWGRHPSSSQHLVRQLLDRYLVYWVNTIGTRRPSLDLDTLRRGIEKLRHWARPAPPGPDAPVNPRVLNPRMWPWFRSRFDRWLNHTLLTRQLLPVLQAERRSITGLTTIPLIADLMDHLPVDRWVYYCVDDFTQWPGLDHQALQQMEEVLVARADVVLAVSETLQARLRRMGRESHLLTHGVEPEFWQLNGQARPVPQLQGLPRPLIVFWGLVDRRTDVEFVRRLAHDLTEGTIVLIGPESAPDPALTMLPRVVRILPLAFEQLPCAAQHAAVLIMPYTNLPVTQAIQPLKLKEYLATGKPTVVRDLPATRVWADCLDLVDSPEAFSEKVRERLATGTPESQLRARGRLRDETWTNKAKQLEQWALPARPAEEPG